MLSKAIVGWLRWRVHAVLALTCAEYFAAGCLVAATLSMSTSVLLATLNAVRSATVHSVIVRPSGCPGVRACPASALMPGCWFSRRRYYVYMLSATST